MDLKSTLSLPARIEALPLGQGFARELALLAGFDDTRVSAIHLACEEAFVAIVHRAAPDSEDPVVISGEVTPLALALTFRDREMLPAPDEDTVPRVEQLTRRLLAESKDLNAMIRGGLAAPTKVDILPPGGIERNPKTGKSRLTLDERH